jgi:DNA polymerase
MGGTADYFYGGKLAENATQAMARDVFADALLRVHDSGVGRIVWHVHDEVIVEVPVDRAQAASDEVRRLMCVPPDWCPTLPLDAESSISSHYCK